MPTLLHTIQIDNDDYHTIREAAQSEGVTYTAKLAAIVAEWAAVRRGREQARREFVAAFDDVIGVIPGGD